MRFVTCSILSPVLIALLAGCTVNTREPARRDVYVEHDAYREPVREPVAEPYHEPVREPVREPIPEPYSPSRSRGELLGRREVNFKVDHDTIHVGKEKGKFHAVTIVVEDGAIEMENIRIRLGDGSVVAPGAPHRFERSGTTLDIDLPGERRYIEQISFTYRSIQRGRGRAAVAVFGR